MTEAEAMEANLRALGIDPGSTRSVDDRAYEAAVALCSETNALTNENAIARRIGKPRGTIQNCVQRLVTAGRLRKKFGPNGRSIGLYPVVV